MKLLKRLSVVFTFIFCGCFLLACGDDTPPKTQLDYNVSVNTQGNYVEVEDKTEMSQYTSSTGESKIETNTGIKFSMYMNFDLDGITTKTTATAIFIKNQQEETEMGIKINMNLSGVSEGITINQTVVSTMYKPNDNFYFSTQINRFTSSYYFSQEDVDAGDVTITDFDGVQDFDFSNALKEIDALVQTENSIVTKSETIENEKTITKYKVVVPAAIEGEHSNNAVLVFTDNVFTGMYYSMDIEGIVTSVSLVPYSGAIEYPSFNGYKHISEMIIVE